MRPLVHLICSLLLLTPAAADALTVHQASIHVNPKKTDAVRVSGTIERFVVGPSDDVHVVLDGVGYTVRAAAFTRKKQKLTYHDHGKSPGVKSLSLDFAHGKFSVALADLVLGSVRSPATLELTAGASASCTRIPLATSVKHPPPDASSTDKERQRSRSFKLIKPKDGESTSCALDGPVLDPAVLVVGDAPTVRVEVAVSATIDAGSIVVRRADVAGVPQGNALCTLVDDGNAAHGDTHAGDGTYGCVLAVDTSAPTRFTIAATATAAGSILRSPPAVVQVAAPLTADQLAAHQAIQTQAEQIWEANKATLGDTLAARLATVAALRLLPGIDDVTLSDEDGSIAIFFPTGVIGGLALTPRVKAPPATLTTAPPSRSSATSADAAPPGPPPDDAVLVGNRKVLVWYGASSLGITPNSTEFETARDAFQNSTCPHFDVASFDMGDATLEELDGMTSYGTVVLVTHGFVERRTASGHPTNAMMIENDRDALVERRDALQRQEVFLSSGISPRFVRELAGQFDHAVMWGGFCYSGVDDATALPFSQPAPTHTLDSLVDAYLEKGVGAYFGFTRAVETDYARGLAGQVFPALVHDLQTTTTAYDAAGPKINPPFLQTSGNPVPEAILAHFIYRPPNGPPLVYLKPAVTPKNPELEALGETALTVTVDGSQDCDLTYHWHNTGTAGHLSGGDDFDSQTATATYQALDVQQQHDTVTVDVIDAGGASPRTLFRLTNTVSIGCTKCAASTLQTRSADTCAPAEACCADHIDNDGDGKTDCDDPDCAGDDACKAVLSGTADGMGTLNVDDDLDVYVNGTQVYSDGNATSSANRPRVPITAQKGDTLRLVVRDTFGGCAHLAPVYFVRGTQSALADPGFDFGCHQPPGNNGVVHDHSFMVPF